MQISLGPWPEGVDGIRDVYSDGFQPGEERRAKLAAGVNVDLDDDGWPQLRAGTTEQVVATAGLSGFEALGLLLFQDQGIIKRVTSVGPPFVTANVVTGLNASARVEFCEHAGAIWWTNGLENGQISAAGTATNWGLTVPSIPTLGTTTGTVPAGRYLVSALCEDANGVEHGASKSAVVTLSSAGAITADLSVTDANTSLCRFFATKPNGDQLFYVGEAAPGALPITISNVGVSDEPLRTQFMSPPIPGDGLFSYNGSIITFKDNYLYPSWGAAVHLFGITAVVETRPTNVLAGAGLDNGFWTVCERGAFWTTGAMPADWVTRQRDDREYAQGVLVLNGGLVPRLKTFERVALFISEDGLMAGMPDGTLLPLTDSVQRLDISGLRASIVYHEHDDFDQILFNLTS